MMTARWLIGVLALSSLIACAAPVATKKTPLPTCVEGDTSGVECAGVAKPSKKNDDSPGVLKTTTGAPLPASEVAKAAEAKKNAEAKADPNADPNTGEVPLPPAKPTTPDAPPAPTTTQTAPTPPAADTLAGVGPKCVKLWACCSNLRGAGITGSADQCDTTALGNDELTCDVANESYKTPDDFYDPVCF